MKMNDVLWKSTPPLRHGIVYKYFYLEIQP